MAAQQQLPAGAGCVGSRFPYNNQIGLRRESTGRLEVEDMCQVLPDGRIACFGVGPIDCMPNRLRYNCLRGGEISCIAFQKVDYGVVNALLPTNQFMPVEWKDSPTRDAAPDEPDEPADPLQVQNLLKMISLGQGHQHFAVSQNWQDFTDIMTAVKEAILARMKKREPNHPQPNNPGNVELVTCETLHEANQWGSWNTPYSSYISKAEQVIEDISGQFPNVHPAIHKWIKAVCDGFTSIGQGALESLLEFLFPNISVKAPGTVQSVVPSPVNTSMNVSVIGGCAHSLVYGYHEEQSSDSNPSGKARGRTPVEYRVALLKVLDAHDDADDDDDDAHKCRSTSKFSRSRSPVRDTGYFYQDLQGINGNRPYSDRSVIDSPGEYIVQSHLHHHYFESHKPDLMVVQTKQVQNLDPGPPRMREEAHVKLVCELSTTRKFGRIDLVPSYLVKITEQCVQSCLASLGYNQDLILGLVVVVDGFKLINIERKENQGHFSYEISESDLILWNNAVGMHEMFHLIGNIL
ncbi:uncharacterized protein [Amphiura filiformis]|uniref:uncharacterized protein n=1 Tax=Amphiura filiformis TaxID=82378 RepID=UPI003B21E2CD